MFQVAFVDLDDTLFSSLHKQVDGKHLEPAALLRDGSTISYASPQQLALIRWLRTSDLVVPVTARTTEAFQRVLIKFDGMAIVSHGATILKADGAPEPSWSKTVDEGLERDLRVLQTLVDLLQRERGGPGGLNVRIAGEPGRPAYLMAKDPAKDPDKVASASERCVRPWIAANPGFTHHLNGNNLAVLPPSIGKRAAVTYVIEQLKREHGELFVIGAGDSFTDVPFMSLCDVTLVPTRSQVWNGVKTRDGGDA